MTPVAGPISGLAGAARGAVQTMRLLAAAEATGGLAACTEMASIYAATREQFGRPIGSFQAIKHHCANMLVDTELAVSATWDAARAPASLSYHFAAASSRSSDTMTSSRFIFSTEMSTR